MSDLLLSMGGYLAQRGHGFFSTTEPYQPGAIGIWLGTLPATPDRGVVLAAYAAPESNSNEPYDVVNVQVRVRGTTDYLVSSNHAQAIYNDLHGLGPTDWPGGVRIVNAVCLQGAPVYIGTDANDRHEHVVNLRVEHHNPTELRPA